MKVRRGRLRQVDLLLRGATELPPEIALVDLELAEDRAGRPHALVELFQDAVVNERNLDVFVAARFTAVGIELAQQVQGRAVGAGGFAGIGRGRVARRVRLGRGGGGVRRGCFFGGVRGAFLGSRRGRGDRQRCPSNYSEY